MSILYANIKATVNIQVRIVYCNKKKFQLNWCKLYSEQKLVVFTAECALFKKKTNRLYSCWVAYSHCYGPKALFALSLVAEARCLATWGLTVCQTIDIQPVSTATMCHLSILCTCHWTVLYSNLQSHFDQQPNNGNTLKCNITAVNLPVQVILCCLHLLHYAKTVLIKRSLRGSCMAIFEYIM